MKGMTKLLAGLALISASFSASADTWADGVVIETLKVSADSTIIVSPVGAPVSGCSKFRFVQGLMNLTARGQDYQYEMALRAYFSGERVNIFFDAKTAECFSGKMEVDQLRQP